MYEILPGKRPANVEYALKGPVARHRELAGKMLDQGVGAVSSATVYRVLREADLFCRWKPWNEVPGRVRPPGSDPRPDERWQTDIRHVKAGRSNNYLLGLRDTARPGSPRGHGGIPWMR